MGKIGDYVHWTAAGYNAYGIYREGKKKRAYGFDGAAHTELGKIIHNVKDYPEAKKLETQLNSFFGNWKKGTMSGTEKKILELVTKKMDEQFGEKLGNITETGDIKLTKELRENSISKLKQVADQNNNKRIVPQEVKKRVDKLNEIREKLAGQSNTDAKELGKRLKEIEILIKQLYGSLTDETVMPREGKRILDKENDLYKKINDAISVYAGLPAVFLQKGEFFEYLVPYVIAAMNDVAEKALDETVEQYAKKIGGERDDVVINQDYFSDGSNGSVNIKFDNSVLNIAHSQGKVDIDISPNGEKVGASLKNVNLSRKYGTIHTVSGSNLLFFLQDIAPNFVNHFLNLNAQHKHKTDDEKLKSIDKIDGEELKAANYAMKRVLAAKALTGHLEGRRSADIFIVNDNKTGNVRIVSMKDLIKAIEKVKNMTEIPVKIGTTSLGVKSLGFINDSVMDDDTLGSMRISNLLGSLRKMKLSAGIGLSLFKNTYLNS